MTQYLAEVPVDPVAGLPIFHAASIANLRHGRVGPEFRYISGSDTDYDESVVKSAHRTLRVFEFFAEHRRPACAIEIASELGMPQSSASMLLRSLVSIGYLSLDTATRRYAPTHRLSLLGAWQPDLACATERLQAIAAELHAETGECVLVAEQYRHFVRYVHVLQSADPAKLLRIPLGTLRPIATTAFGHVLLAQKSDRDVRGLLHRARADRGSMDHGLDFAAALEAVQRAGTAGFACTSRAVDDLLTFQLAAPVRGHPELAIGIVSYGERFLDRCDELLGQVRRHAGWSDHA